MLRLKLLRKHTKHLITIEDSIKTKSNESLSRLVN